MNLWRTLLDIAYPRICGGCGAEAMRSGGHWCWACRTAIELIGGDYCSICGDPIDGIAGHRFVCSACRKNAPKFDIARSAARFRGPLKNAIHQFKYGVGFHMLDDLADLLIAVTRVHYSTEPLDAICCVPLHPRKLAQRGYNQAELLAQCLGKALGLPVWPGALVRTRYTATQTHQTASERLQNIRNAFAPSKPSWIKGRSFILVDDVMTTGATVNECSRALKEAGAWKVYVATVARG